MPCQPLKDHAERRVNSNIPRAILHDPPNHKRNKGALNYPRQVTCTHPTQINSYVWACSSDIHLLHCKTEFWGSARLIHFLSEVHSYTLE